MNKINRIILGVCVSRLISCLFYSQDQAHAQSRLEVEAIQDKVNNAERSIDILNDSIKEQQDKIKLRESQIDTQKEIVRAEKAKLNSSWTSYLDVQQAEKDLQDIINILTDEKDYLGELITERSNHFKFIRENKDVKFVGEPYDGTHLTKLVGVDLSKTCLLIESCPTYKDLYSLDSSIEEKTGVFVDEPYFHRGPSPLENPWRLYDTDDTIRVIVDPPNGMADRIKMITIVPSLDNYTLQHDEIEDGNRVVFHDRYIDNCKNATISAKHWLMLLPITIHDLRNGCTDSEFNEREIINVTKSEIDITTSPNWQAAQKLISDKERCKVLC